MSPDPVTLRRRADRLRAVAIELRESADELLREAEGVFWEGRTGDRLRAVARDRVSALLHTAERHDAAAEALDLHAVAVKVALSVLAKAADEALDLAVEAIT